MNRSLKCRIGDLAVIVDAHHKVNIGKIVKVVDTYSESKAQWLEGRPVLAFDWIVECPTPLVWSGAGKRSRRKRGPVPDMALQPIRGLPTAEKAARSEGLRKSHAKPMRVSAPKQTDEVAAEAAVTTSY